MKLSIFRNVLVALYAFLAANSASVQGCSRILWNDNGQTVVSGRSMDWSHSFDDWMFAYPRGEKMTGGNVPDSAQWTSKYGSVGVSIIGYAKQYGYDFSRDGDTDGLNEKGLAVHVLYLGETEYGGPDGRPTVSYMRWARYLLDNFATVAEAVEGMKKTRIASVPIGKAVLGAHVAIEDKSGDSAIFEIVKGKMTIHHGPQYRVMTNDPVYDEQIANLSRYEGFGGKLEMPGATASEHRFVRASYYLKFLPKPANDVEAIATIRSLIQNITVPFGAPYGDGVYPTWWTSAVDLKDEVYYFNWVRSPNVIWVPLDELNLAEGQPVRTLNPRDPKLVGDVSRLFEPVGKP